MGWRAIEKVAERELSGAGRPRERGQSLEIRTGHKEPDPVGPRRLLKESGFPLREMGSCWRFWANDWLQDWHVRETAQEAESQRERAGGEKVMGRDRERRVRGFWRTWTFTLHETGSHRKVLSWGVTRSGFRFHRVTWLLGCEQTQGFQGDSGMSGDHVARRRCRSRGQMKWVDSRCIWGPCGRTG